MTKKTIWLPRDDEAGGDTYYFQYTGIEVHAKVALVLRYNKEGKQTRSYAISVPEISMRRLPGYMLIPVCSLPTRLL